MKRTFSASVFCRRYRKEVLLIRHRRLGLWLPVGGELEGNETPLEAAMREVYEETRFTQVHFPKIKYAPAGTPNGFLGYEEHDAGDKGQQMNFCFLAEVGDQDPKSDGSWDHYQWVNPYDAQGDKYLGAPDNVRDLLWQILLTRTE